MPNDSEAAFKEPSLCIALSSRHLPSPKTPWASFVFSQSLSPGLSFFIFLLFQLWFGAASQDSCLPLLGKATKLALANSHAVLITNATDLYSLCLESPGKLKSLSAR
jgi:hypothetical protein